MLKEHELRIIREVVAEKLAGIEPGATTSRVPWDVMSDDRVKYIASGREEEIGRAVSSIVREELLRPPAHSHARREEGFIPKVPREARAFEEDTPPRQDLTQAVSAYAPGIRKMAGVEPLGSEPAAKHNIHPTLYDPRPEKVEEWLRANVANANEVIVAYRKHLQRNTQELHFDPYRASWEALLSATFIANPPQLRDHIDESLERAKRLLKENVLRDAFAGRMDMEQALRLLKPSVNLVQMYNELFSEHFRRYGMSDKMANLAILNKLLAKHAPKARQILVSVVRADKELLGMVEKIKRIDAAKGRGGGGGAGGGASGRTLKLRSDQRMPRALKYRRR